MKNMSVLEAKRFGVYTCRKTDSLRHVAEQMTERDVSALIVVDDTGFLQGIITRTDLVRACCQSDDWSSQPVEHYMSEDVVTVKPDDTLLRVMTLLLDKHIHRVVVVQNQRGQPKPIAVLSAADVIYHMVRHG
jgi:signal-transduction protein with cAMP-binding, CBS, and nucleotidyltransferase domain